MRTSAHSVFVSRPQREWAAERRAIRDFAEADQLLAEQMFLARHIARAGTGTLDMALLSKEAGLAEPQFRFEHGQFIQVLWRPEVVTMQVTPQVTHQATHQATHQVDLEVAAEIAALVRVLDGAMSRGQIQVALQLKDRVNLRRLYLAPALAAGLIARTLPHSISSPQQRYLLTPAGVALRQRLVAVCHPSPKA